LQEVFFNHVSYLFYQIPLQQAEDIKGLIAMFKQQMYDQVKSGFPKDLAEASLLTRIVPLGLFGKMLHIPLKGKVATFAFSHLGKSSYQSTAFMGSAIENLFHMPRVPVPPGLGFFSNYYNNRLNLVISYLDGLLTDEQVLMIESGIRKRFGGSSS
jgi:phospholipid N-methyltransferase